MFLLSHLLSFEEEWEDRLGFHLAQDPEHDQGGEERVADSTDEEPKDPIDAEKGADEQAAPPMTTSVTMLARMSTVRPNGGSLLATLPGKAPTRPPMMSQAMGRTINLPISPPRLD